MDIKDSDSDVSDGWSLVDAASQSESGSVKDVFDDNESVNCTASDGESLEIIQEENDERKQFIESISDVENDCFSVISNCSSMIEDAASDNIEWNTSKLQTYVHRRNCLLNARLNFVVVVAVAAVAGLGVGHFIGSHEDCPSLPNVMPDISVDLADRAIPKKPKHESYPYFHQPLISHMLKAKRKVHIQQNYDGLEDSFCDLGQILGQGKCFSTQEESEINFLKQDHKNDVGVKKCTDEQSELCSIQYSEDSACEKCDIRGEKKHENQNQIDNIHLKEITKVKPEEYLHQHFEDDVEGKNHVKLVHVSQDFTSNVHSDGNTGIWQKDNIHQHAKDYTKLDKIELEHPSAQDMNDKYSKKHSDQNSDAIVLSLGSSVPQECAYQEMKGIISAKEDEARQKGLTEILDSAVPSKDAMDDSYIEVGTDDEISVANYKIAVHNVDHGDNSGISREETLEENVHKFDDHCDMPSEPEKQTSEQLPWLKRFSDTIEHMHFPAESKLFFIVDLLTSLKQSIVELDQTIVTNESSKFLKKMKMSVNKMKETVERIQKDASSWSAKTTEKIQHKLFKLKSKVQEKWCDVKDQYQHQNANIFSWLKNNLFQDCKTDYKTYHIELPNEKSNTPNSVVTKKVKESHQNLGKSNKKKTHENNFGIKDSGNNKAKSDKHEGNSYKFKTIGDNTSSKNYGYARNAPDYAGHDFRKSSKGAFDKLRHHSTKCPPHCKDENKEHNYVDPTEKWALARKIAADWKDSSNVSGIWMLRMSQGRAESRRNDQKSDWLFERARARKLRRDTDHERANWYFDRAQKRENCRLNPQSDWCVGVKRSLQEPKKYSYDHFEDDDDEEDDEDEDDKQDEYFRPKFWSRKIPSAPYAKTGKWLKNTVKEFKQKMNYYQYNQHKFHYV